MGHFDEVKRTQQTLLIYQKCLWQSLKLFSCFITSLKREVLFFVNFFKVSIGKSRKFQSTHCLTFLIVCSIVKEIQNVFLEKN